MKTKQKENEKTWQKAYIYAKTKYNGQHVLDVPAKIGKMSYTYTNDKNKTIRVYYV